MITIQDTWERAFDGPAREGIEKLLPAFFTSSRWFGGKAKTIRSARFSDILRVDMDAASMTLAFVKVTYAEGGVETYTLPMTASFGQSADRIRREHPAAIIGSINVIEPKGSKEGLLHDALWNEGCAHFLLDSMGRRARFHGPSGTLVASATPAFDDMAVDTRTPVSVMKAEQSNTSVKFGDRVMLKLYRRAEPGLNPELEIGRTLTSRKFGHSPALIGALEFTRESDDEPTTVALAQTFIPNQGNAWEFTLTQLSRYFDGVSGLPPHQIAPDPSTIQEVCSPPVSRDLFFGFLEAADLLGRRTAELHVALGATSSDPAFAPETCPSSYLRSRAEAMALSTTRALTLLRSRWATLSQSDQAQAQRVLDAEPAILARLGVLVMVPPNAMRIRCHGDYHLGQVLYTGHDFVIIDYEGEPARPLAERRAKHSPILDLAGMIRSFHYATHAALRQRLGFQANDTATPDLSPWAHYWYRSVRATFLSGYRAVASRAPFYPQSREEFDILFDVHVLEKALYELTYELNNRPDWIAIPLSGILQLFDASNTSSDYNEMTDRPEDENVPRPATQPKG